MGLSLQDDSDRRVDGPPSLFRPPCLTYFYVPEVSYDSRLHVVSLSAECGDPCAQVPVLVEGSILRNLMMGDDRRRRIPTEDEAWKIAKLCGLPAEFLHVRSTCQMILAFICNTSKFYGLHLQLSI